ncbi:MAG TPA: hypothetical protein VHG08_24735 [Longimicrobium sp.]|nr:hypothetical protein [Longimicrobium sp.]
MIRIAGISALGLALNTCPFASEREAPDGYAHVTGSVVMQDGSPFSGQGHALCWRAPHPEPSFNRHVRVEDGTYATVLEAPLGSRPQPGEPFEFLCRVQAMNNRALVARRYVSVPFSRDHSDFPSTRIDLRAGEIEPEP